mgnify:CR=1 FL=1
MLLNELALLGGLVGGVGLFLLGMGLMTDGLKLAAGPSLQNVLARSTRTRWHGLFSGILVTALVQASGAVTVAVIGFVNVGLLNLSQALWLLLGANVGTTMTGWLVALVGLKFKIEVLALPMVGVGMVLRLTGEKSRRGAFGMALAGFGVLFLGIDLLKETFSGLSTHFVLPAGDGVFDTLLQVLIGVVLTVLMQSSSAALVVALTAAQGGLLTAQGAAAVVIGANIGTTVTALLAVIGATANARRVAVAHILFNLLTGVIALLLLPWLLVALSNLGEWLGLDDAPASKIALFHTAFNVLGVLLIWPFAERLTRFLQSRFRQAEEDEARPRYLDKTVLAVPALALDALEREVRRMGSIALNTLRATFADPDGGSGDFARDRDVAERLSRAIADFIVELNRVGMSGGSARRLPELLRLARYYEAATEAAVEAAAAATEWDALATDDRGLAPAYAAFREQAEVLLASVDPANPPASSELREQRLGAMEADYQLLKAGLLEAGAQGNCPVVVMDARLRAASALRRALQQTVKAARLMAQ